MLHVVDVFGGNLFLTIFRGKNSLKICHQNLTTQRAAKGGMQKGVGHFFFSVSVTFW